MGKHSRCFDPLIFFNIGDCKLLNIMVLRNLTSDTFYSIKCQLTWILECGSNTAKYVGWNNEFAQNESLLKVIRNIFAQLKSHVRITVLLFKSFSVGKYKYKENRLFYRTRGYC